VAKLVDAPGLGPDAFIGVGVRVPPFAPPFFMSFGMSTAIENISNIERRVALNVPLSEIDQEVQTRLKRMQRTVRMSGFRPGKVPFQLIARQYGHEVHIDVVNQKLGDAFNKVVTDNKLRVVGAPKVQSNEASAQEGNAGFTATFEIYPEITFGDFKTASVEKSVVDIGDTEVDKTIEILRKQRATYSVTDRGVKAEDKVTVNFVGQIDGVVFPGGKGEGFSFVSGAGRMLPEFEAAAIGMKAGQTKDFALSFPADYHGKEVAGKTATFTLSVLKVEEPVLPAVDAEFAKTLGIAGGEQDKMRVEIKQNLQREVATRTKQKTKESVMDALIKIADFTCPTTLIQSEAGHLAEQARNDLRQRGMQVNDAPFPADLFTAQAERRVRLGLILAELVEKHNLRAKPEQVRAHIESAAQSYENPAEVIGWYFNDKSRLADVEALVLEDNVVSWVLQNATVSPKSVSFDELMGKNNES
jgi:trigger factor